MLILAGKMAGLAVLTSDVDPLFLADPSKPNSDRSDIGY